jgi:hypothetical protein
VQNCRPVGRKIKYGENEHKTKHCAEHNYRNKMCLLYEWENIGGQNKKTLKKETQNIMWRCKKDGGKEVE